ncbi:uncharacterized protein BROUX77_000536 [Berkeleyomyces rouxiae]|uniref:uncharacterized protein n=1 Tax=Berkeleyomyces rouxiae TaxID=2035830 RepID=UPI003B7C8419
MSLGFTRLNVRKSPPNTNITFIKPLVGPNEAIAQDFLERIAAQCYPVMKANHIHVRSLEEYEPNREFVGRNFNAGEVVQLVLRSPTSGRWLPFEYVQMVMMHELAHCKQMNHSRAFWAVRNQYARLMERLWADGYTGEGIWGVGRALASGTVSRPTILASERVPQHLCGGTYRTNTAAGRKRRAPKLSSKEQKERRILKKFGANGVAVGADEAVKSELEKTTRGGGAARQTAAKPRVAGSMRGRELRAAAALARFDQCQSHKKEEDPEDSTKVKPEVIELSDSDDDAVSDGFDVVEIPDELDIDGKRLTDKDGKGMVKVCDDDDADGGGDDIKIFESDEWQELSKRFWGEARPGRGESAPPIPTSGPVKHEDDVDVVAMAARKSPALSTGLSKAQVPKSQPRVKPDKPKQQASSKPPPLRKPPPAAPRPKKADSRTQALGFTRTLGSASSDPLPANTTTGPSAGRTLGRGRNTDPKQPSVADMLQARRANYRDS